MDKGEYKQYIEEEYKDDPDGFAIYLTLLFEYLKSNEKRQKPEKIRA